jgi:hypothetical protein
MSWTGNNLADQKEMDNTLKKIEPEYDPAMFATMILLVILTAGVLFWLLWTALVYQGGIFAKIQALWWVLSGKKSWAELVSPDWPIAAGIFSGWLANVVAVMIILASIILLYRFYQRQFPTEKNNELQ